MNAPVDVTAVQIETPRLILRPFRESDLVDIYEYACVDGVGEMAGWKHHESIAETQEILRCFISGKKTLALELKENGKCVGSVGLESLSNVEDTSLQGREIGYVLSKSYWGRGLIPEAVQAVIAFCFDTLSMDFVTCAHFLWNYQSRRVIEKCGFRYWKEISYRTNLGTVEEAKLYILLNPNKSEVNHV